MSTQAEAVLENQLISQLKELGYTYVKIKDETALISNLKQQFVFSVKYPE